MICYKTTLWDTKEIFAVMAQHLMVYICKSPVIKSDSIIEAKQRSWKIAFDIEVSPTFFALRYLFQESCRSSQDCKNQSWTSDGKAISCVCMCMCVYTYSGWAYVPVCIRRLQYLQSIAKPWSFTIPSSLFTRVIKSLAGVRDSGGRWKKMWWSSLLTVAQDVITPVTEKPGICAGPPLNTYFLNYLYWYLARQIICPGICLWDFCCHSNTIEVIASLYWLMLIFKSDLIWRRFLSVVNKAKQTLGQWLVNSPLKCFI